MMTIKEAINDYLDKKASLAESSRDKYGRILRRWLRALAAAGTPPTLPVEKLTIEMVDPFVEQMCELVPTTRRVYAAALKGFYEYVELRQLAGVSTTRLGQLLDQAVNGSYAPLVDYAAEEVEMVIATAAARAAGPWEEGPDGERRRLAALRDYALVVTLADTGMRESEAVGLRRGDVQWSARPTVRAKVTGKGRKDRWVFFSARAVAALRAYLAARQPQDAARGRPLHTMPLFTGHARKSKGTPLDTRAVRRVVGNLARAALPAERAGAVHPHTFRHHFLTMMWKATGDLKLAQVMAGHASVGTTTRYTHADVEGMAEAYARVFDVRGVTQWALPGMGDDGGEHPTSLSDSSRSDNVGDE